MCVCPSIPDTLIITVADAIEPGTLLKPSTNIIMTCFPLQFQLNSSIAEKDERATLVVHRERGRETEESEGKILSTSTIKRYAYQEQRQTFPWFRKYKLFAEIVFFWGGV